MQFSPMTIRELEEIAKYELAIGKGHSVSGTLGVLRNAAAIRIEYDRPSYRGPVYLIFTTLRDLLAMGPDVYLRDADGGIHHEGR